MYKWILLLLLLLLLFIFIHIKNNHCRNVNNCNRHIVKIAIFHVSFSAVEIRIYIFSVSLFVLELLLGIIRVVIKENKMPVKLFIPQLIVFRLEGLKKRVVGINISVWLLIDWSVSYFSMPCQMTMRRYFKIPEEKLQSLWPCCLLTLTTSRLWASVIVLDLL